MSQYLSLWAEEKLTYQGESVLLVEFSPGDSIRQFWVGDYAEQNFSNSRSAPQPNVRLYKAVQASQTRSGGYLFQPSAPAVVSGPYWSRHDPRKMFGRSFQDKYLPTSSPEREQAVRRFLLPDSTLKALETGTHCNVALWCECCQDRYPLQGGENFSRCRHIQWVNVLVRYGGCGIDLGADPSTLKVYKESLAVLLSGRAVEERSSVAELAGALRSGVYSIDPRFPLNYWRSPATGSPHFGFEDQYLSRSGEGRPLQKLRQMQLDPYYRDPELSPGIIWLSSLQPGSSRRADALTADWIDEILEGMK